MAVATAPAQRGPRTELSRDGKRRGQAVGEVGSKLGSVVGFEAVLADQPAFALKPGGRDRRPQPFRPAS